MSHEHFTTFSRPRKTCYSLNLEPTFLGKKISIYNDAMLCRLDTGRNLPRKRYFPKPTAQTKYMCEGGSKNKQNQNNNAIKNGMFPVFSPQSRQPCQRTPPVPTCPYFRPRESRYATRARSTPGSTEARAVLQYPTRRQVQTHPLPRLG